MEKKMLSAKFNTIANIFYIEIESFVKTDYNH